MKHVRVTNERVEPNLFTPWFIIFLNYNWGKTLFAKLIVSWSHSSLSFLRFFKSPNTEKQHLTSTEVTDYSYSNHVYVNAGSVYLC